MLFSDLALILTIMINTLILHQSSEARKIGRNGRTNKTLNMRQRKWYLDPVMLKLAIVVDNYDEKKDLIETIYSGVTECGLNKCEKFQRLIPENQLMARVGCSRDNFKKMILNKLIKFHRGVRIIEKTFRDLIYFEETSHFYNRTRRTFLTELEINIKMLNQEIECVMPNERLNFSRQPETSTPSSLLHPDSETHLRINEWRIIQDSKQFLGDWKKNFEKIFKCWKKRRQKKRKKKETLNQNHHNTPQPTQILRNSTRMKNFNTIFSRRMKKFPAFSFQINKY